MNFTFLANLFNIKSCLLGCLLAVLWAIQPVFAQQKIGISVPLSGNAAPLGRQYITGARLALKTLSQESSIDLIISDDGCDKDLAELAIDDIVNAGAILVTGFLCNAPLYSAANLLKNKNIPLLISAARSNRIQKDRARYEWNIWQISPTDSDISRIAFEMFSKRWRSVPYAIVDDGTVFGRTQADEFRALMEEAGIKPQFVDNFRPAQSTQAGLIRRLTRAGVEAVFLAANADDVAVIAKNALKKGIKLEIATGEAVSVLPYMDNNSGIPVGLLAILPTPPEELSGIAELNPIIEAAGLEPEPYLLLGYATMQVVIAALNQPKLEFANQNYSTVLGDVTFNNAGKNTSNNYQLYRWNGKNFSRIDKSTSTN